MSAARNRARINHGTLTVTSRYKKMPALAPTHCATTGEQFKGAQSGLPNLQRIAAPIAISNRPLSL
jgi:hypothetical protein